ncbi:non-hydrolyzing UDP-N-acetylglucosamine 2-epimerase [Pelagibius marinus]|uniref:non-hydrolyzing UDP-N-acetylglucosamine 2-epimerase n=1 Tax=Pelagibius marinus TaxID=2762760 RepID=UPI001872A512|nr:UDP-N-acetylglucosamine 2-epimerase (non-hydrolyzing) [Pelagibius marinus]
MLKLVTVIGARPQFIKAAAVSRAVARQDGIAEVMVHTGQHFDTNMSEIFFEELGIPAPDHHLDIAGGSHGEMTGRMLAAIEAILIEEKPDWVLVYGDTNSTLAGALAAAKLHIPVAHVEAGLRSFNRRMPEEINRVLTDHVSARLYCPTTAAVKNLADEGIREGVMHVGDVMYDATLDARGRARSGSDILVRLGVEPGRYSLATVHRAENTDDAASLRAVIAHLEKVALERTVILPLHPRTAQASARFGISLEALKVIEPVGYLDMSALLDGCADVHTDSGGVQKEAYFHGKPCVTLRGETEWVETVEAGWNRLWSMPDYKQPRRPIGEYGRGNAAELIVADLVMVGV